MGAELRMGLEEREAPERDREESEEKRRLVLRAKRPYFQRVPLKKENGGGNLAGTEKRERPTHGNDNPQLGEDSGQFGTGDRREMVVVVL